MTAYRFLEPLDVLLLRGNKLFGDPGSYGESLLPPWPSVAAGAIRTQMLAVDGQDLQKFADNRQPHPKLGTPAQPGSFLLSDFQVARRNAFKIEALHQLPADIVASRQQEGLVLQRLSPGVPSGGVAGSYPLPNWPILSSEKRAKPISGLWLDEQGWRQYLDGGIPADSTLVDSDSLWKFDYRVGVGLNPTERRAEEGKLFSVQAVSFAEGHGFLAGIKGAEPPASGTLRLGGDGRAAAVYGVDYRPYHVDLEAIASSGRCRLVLTAPGLFPGGWRIPGLDTEYRFQLGGVSARLVCAAAARAEVVSGWDLANRQPKPAQRTVSPGSVYWLEELAATPEQLRKLADHGLWPDAGYDRQRRAEGFNRFTFAVY